MDGLQNTITNLENGDPYISLVNYYRKNNFAILTDNILEFKEI